MARLIQVFEHETLTLYENIREEKLEQNELNKLLDFNDKNDNVYFTAIRDGVKFCNYVGVIQIGGLTIEILPKADKDPSNYGVWRDVLLNMLQVCKKITLTSVSEASLAQRKYSILDLYFELYINEVNQLIRRGLIKRYRRTTSNTNALKGNIHFAKNIQRNLIHKESFFTSHEIYDYEHLVNQILLKALIILSKISTNIYINGLVSQIMLSFPEIKDINIKEVHFKKLKESRKTDCYLKALRIAKMIILQYSPDIKNGKEDMLAILFDMNKLWEEYVFRMLQKTAHEDYVFEFQNRKKFWNTKEIRPDIIATYKQNEKTDIFVIDTKWKIIDSGSPSDHDLKQMYAYNLYWGAEKSLLLYPMVNATEEITGKYHIGRDGRNECSLGFVSVLNEQGKALDSAIGDKILEKLQAMSSN